MSKVFSEKELYKQLLDEPETLYSAIHYKSVSLKKDGVLVLFQMKVGLDMKDTFLNYENKPRPFLILSHKDVVDKVISEIEHDMKAEVLDIEEKQSFFLEIKFWGM